MGTLTFQLPAGSGNCARELERACLAGGPDVMPWATNIDCDGGLVHLGKLGDESGYLLSPWDLAPLGKFMILSATLMEGNHPYDYLLELVRGKVNQVRNQAADWSDGGLHISEGLHEQIRQAVRAFGKAALARSPYQGANGSEEPADPQAFHEQARRALEQAHRTAEELSRTYRDQVFHIRHQREPQLGTTLTCGVPALPRAGGPPVEAPEAFRAAFNAVNLPLSWHLIEAEEARYCWEGHDALIDWAEQQGLPVVAGPLIDFSSANLPAWLWTWERDHSSITTFMCRFVTAAVRRYRGRVRQWQLTGGSNWANVLGFSEQELLGLTYRIGDAALQADSSLPVTLGVSQPWGEYLAENARNQSPFIFADTLIRSGLNLAGLDVEVVMGVQPRGSYCRDLLELSRMLDLYALLGLPLQVTLGYPSASGHDPSGDPEMVPAAGRWREGFTPESQADWAEAFAALALCKPYVRSVRWCHWSDAAPHAFPHCGLLDHEGKPKPALARLRGLREHHLA
jgi:hypothetical protein